MLRTDLANRLQPATDLALRPTPQLQEITDQLSGLVVGQRLLAEIQSLLPNGSYRAMINQRSITLALPFSAQTGDAIELEVAETDGKLTLAVMAKAGPGQDGDSSSTSLSRTGQLIGNLLLGSTHDSRTGPQALPLNNNQPIAASPPSNGRELLPLLEQAIRRSGMFYEAHQAQWVEGRFDKAQLLQEPQGRLAPQVSPEPPRPAAASEPAQTASTPAAGSGPLPPSRSSENTVPNNQVAQISQPVAPQVQSVVQQQLEAFATQLFSWQGQLWPGQDMRWEIEKPTQQDASASEEEQEKWRTRLLLTLPRLGEIEARLAIQGKDLALTISAADSKTRALLRDGADTLNKLLEQAGLRLDSLGITLPAHKTDPAQPAGRDVGKPRPTA